MTDETTDSVTSVISDAPHRMPPPRKRNPQPPPRPVGATTHIVLDPDRYRYPNEKDVLYTTVGILSVLVLFASIPTMGAVAGGIIVGIVLLKLDQRGFLGACVAVSERQFPEIHTLAVTAARRLGMPTPPVFILQTPVLNAFALGFSGSPSVVLHSAIVEALSDTELLTVLGHEFSHIKCGHTMWLFLVGQGRMRIPVFTTFFEYVFKWWSRKAELTCDRGGLLASRDLHASIATQGKLAVGKELFERLQISEFLEQKQRLDATFLGKVSEALQTHPYGVNRIRKLIEFAESDAYRQIVAEIP